MFNVYQGIGSLNQFLFIIRITLQRISLTMAIAVAGLLAIMIVAITCLYHSKEHPEHNRAI